MVGTQLDKYELLQKIGEGGMATVWRGRHTTLDREVAIKILHPHISASPRNRKRFAREARAIEHLDHDNILKIYDYSGVDANNCYIVTEFVEGHTIQQLLDARGLLPSEVVAMIGLELSEALHYAHVANIIHRDLKAENVMVRADGTVKLMDFGIARFLDESTVTMTGALVGSPAYMSPEQALERPVDARSDLFSLGTLFFHMITGRLPFSGTNPSVILRNIIEGNRSEVLEVQPGVSPRLASVVERLLQVDIENRFESAAQVRQELASLLEEVEISPSDRDWSIITFLAEPDHYELKLRIHLDRVLLEHGRKSLTEGDHLGAQRMFNRLLAFDPNHPQVLELLSSLHQPREAPRKRVAALTVSAVLAALLAAGSWLLLRPEPQAIDASVEAVESTEPVAAVGLGGAGAADAQSIPSEPVAPDEAPLETEDGSAADPLADVAQPDEETPASETPEEAPLAADAAQAGTTSGGDSPNTEPAAVTGEAAADATGDGVADLAPGAGLPEDSPKGKPDLDASATIMVKLARAGWAYVLIDGESLGRIPGKQHFQIPPGDHVLTLQNPFAQDYNERFTIAGDETRTFDGIILQRKPIVVFFSPQTPESCSILKDGAPTPVTVGDLEQGRLRIQDPGSWRRLSLECPDGLPRELELDQARPGDELVFPTLP